MMDTNKIHNSHILFLILLSLGIMMRYIVMTLGHNYDFDSYCIVGEISGNFRNVYAETTRYNYAPLFLCVQGTLYRIAQVNPNDWILIYRVLIVTVLTMADLGIAGFIAHRYSVVMALEFFLNPISIIITGYHNQFDNIAVLFALFSIIFFNDEKKFNKKDIGFIVFFSLSMITKHILFLQPIFILLMKKVPIKKRVLYAFVPPMMFLISFVPFMLSSDAAFQGIVNNVFRYRSFNNAPLLSVFYALINFPSDQRIIVYGIMMVIVAWFIRDCNFESIIFIYLIAMVAFSSAIANQYLVIPMAALCILNVAKWDKIYMLAIGLYLFLEKDGLNVLGRIQTCFNGSIIDILGGFYVRRGYILATWILFFSLVHLIMHLRKGEDLMICHISSNV